MITGLVAGIVMIGVLVVIHEFGHFIVAKAFGIGVPVFSVGMGPRIWGFEWRGTDYRLSLLPVGGYVRMAGADPFGDEDPDDAWVDPSESLMTKPVWQRLLVMLAGPVFNLALPFVVFTAVLMAGEPQPDATVGTIMPDTPAERAGLEEGDRITAINGEDVEVWADLVIGLDDHKTEAIELQVDRAGSTFAASLPVGSVAYTIDGLVDMESIGLWSNRVSSRVGVDDPASPAARAGIVTGDGITHVDGVEVKDLQALRAALSGPGPFAVDIVRAEGRQVVESSATLTRDPAWSPRDPDTTDAFGLTPVQLFVGGVREDSPAEAAGVQEGDRIRSVDGKRVLAWSQLIHMVGATVDPDNPGAAPRALKLELVRGGQLVELDFAPRVERDVVRGEVRWRPIMGIQQFTQAFTAGPRVKKYYSFVEAVPRAIDEGVLVFNHTIKVLGNLFTGKLKPSESVGGPVEIFRMAGESARRGIYTFARNVGVISFSLGIINLLPVPVLDGGQIFFYAIEGIRGRPLSLEIREKVQMVGVLALGAIMLMVTVMDVSRWLGS